MFEKLVSGDIRCNEFWANYPPPGGLRVEHGICDMGANSMVIVAYGGAADRAAEVMWLTKSSRDGGSAPLIVYGDDWAMICDDETMLSVVQRALGGTIVS
ncbi:hypothetical protein [Streptosporangium roseum]|uniref:hypothetical protein n=1 Tax=Streptosporangium roseum TaxID=2001 RepID=UPI00332ED9F4